MSWAIEISKSVEHTGWADEIGKCKEHTSWADEMNTQTQTHTHTHSARLHARIVLISFDYLDSSSFIKTNTQCLHSFLLTRAYRIAIDLKKRFGGLVSPRHCRRNPTLLFASLSGASRVSITRALSPLRWRPTALHLLRRVHLPAHHRESNRANRTHDIQRRENDHRCAEASCARACLAAVMLHRGITIVELTDEQSREEVRAYKGREAAILHDG